MLHFALGLRPHVRPIVWSSHVYRRHRCRCGSMCVCRTFDDSRALPRPTLPAPETRQALPSGFVRLHHVVDKSQRHVRLRVCSHRPESTTTTVVTYLTVTAVDRRSRRSWPSWGRSDTIPVCIHRFERKPESVVFWMLCPVIHVGKNAVVFTSSPGACRACDIVQSDDSNRSSLLERGPTIWCQIEDRKESDDSSTHCGCWVCGVFIVPPLWLRNLVPDLDLQN